MAKRVQTRERRPRNGPVPSPDKVDLDSAGTPKEIEGDLDASLVGGEDEAMDDMRRYLCEIGRIPLLTPAQERDLGLQVVEAAAERLLPPLQQRRSVVRQGEEAARQLTEANLRLVVAIAKEHRRRTMSLLDVIQEGNLGLMHAVQKFDPRKGYRFSTYATWWIRQAVHRGLAEKDRTIRVPVYVVEELQRFVHVCEQLVQELGREPQEAEIASEMGIDCQKARLLLGISDPVSLQITVYDGLFEAELGNFIADPQQNTVREAMEAIDKELLHEVLALLPERERTVLELRYGLLDERGRTLDEVGRELHVSRERIRQLERTALRRLQHPSRRHRLADTLC